MNTNISEYFKVLSDPNRLEIVALLLQGETCGCKLIDNLPISQPTLSYHLKSLSHSGLATSVREGNQINYSIDRDKIKEMIEFLNQLLTIEATECSISK